MAKVGKSEKMSIKLQEVVVTIPRWTSSNITLVNSRLQNVK